MKATIRCDHIEKENYPVEMLVNIGEKRDLELCTKCVAQIEVSLLKQIFEDAVKAAVENKLTLR